MVERERSEEPGGSSRPRRGEPPLVRHGMVILIYLIGYYLLTFPALHTMSTHLLTDGGDGLQNFWNNWWVRRAVAHGANPWFTDFLFAPDGVSLVGATLNPFNGFATIPLCWFVGPITAYNVMVVFAFVAGGYTTFLLAREIGAQFWPSVFAGAMFTFGPFHFAHALGHMQLVSLQWLPLFFLAWIRLLRAPGYGIAVGAASVLFLNLLCDYYYTLYCVVGGTILFVCKAAAERRLLFFLEPRMLRALVVFLVSSSILCGPQLGALIAMYVGHDLAGSHAGEGYVNDLFAWIIPGSAWRFHGWTEWFWGRHPSGHLWSEFGSHVGILTAGFAAYGLYKSWGRKHAPTAWSLFILGAVFYGVSLGPTLLVMGEWYPQVPMPFDLVELVFPMIQLSGVPVRMAVVTCLVAAVLAALGLSDARRLFARRRWLLVPFLAFFVVEILPRPQKTFRPTTYPAVEALRDMPPGIVAGLPELTGLNLLLQTRFEKPMTAGYVARVPRPIAYGRARQERLVREGRLAELMATTGADYLLLPWGRECDVAIPHSLKCVARDPDYAVFAPDTADLPTVPFPRMSYELRAAAGRATLEITWPEYAGREFVCVFSGGLAERHRLYSQPSHLARDALFDMSFWPTNPALSNRGRLDTAGRARVEIETTSMNRETQSIWFSVGVIQPEPPLRLTKLSKPRPLAIQK